MRVGGCWLQNRAVQEQAEALLLRLHCGDI